MNALHTERLVLRIPKESDFEAYAAMCADADFMRYLGEGKPLSRAEAWRSFAVVVGHWQLRGFGLWSVEEKQSGAYVGRVGCWYPEGWPGFEIGWALRPEYWGRGYATEAAKASIEYAFLELGQPKVISLILPGNDRSVRVAERLGERLEGNAEVMGREAMVYGIGRGEWEDAHQAVR